VNGQRIYKYPVRFDDTFEVLMPRGAVVLSVATQDDHPQMWARVDPAQPMLTRRFHLRGTGHPLTGEEGRFIGTFLMRSGALVFHLFEAID